jgi:hypothetical protein
MQETRLNLLINTIINRFNKFFNNPWRKLSLVFLCLFIGFFSASTLTANVGQAGAWDTSVAFIYLIIIESINMIVYQKRNDSPNNSLWINIINSLKIGFIYDLFLESLKLNS